MMTGKKTLFFITITTIAITRIFLWYLQTHGLYFPIYFGPLRWHHLYTGIILVMASLFVPRRFFAKALFFGIGLGFIIDEAALALTLSRVVDPDYWSLKALVGTLAGLIVCFSLIFIADRKRS